MRSHVRRARSGVWSRAALLVLLAIPASARADVTLSIPELTLWVNAFVPGEIPDPPDPSTGSYTRRLSQPTKVGDTGYPHPFERLPWVPLSALPVPHTYVTDQRPRSPLFGASARIHVEIRLRADGHTGKVAVDWTAGGNDWVAYPTVDTEPPCRKAVDASGIKVDAEELLVNGEVGTRLRVHGGVRNACDPLSWFSGRIRLDLNLEVRFVAQRIACEGKVDVFPAYEAYFHPGTALGPNTVGRRIFDVGPAPGMTAADLGGWKPGRTIPRHSVSFAPASETPFSKGEQRPDDEAQAIGPFDTQIARDKQTAPSEGFRRLRVSQNGLIEYADDETGTDVPKADHVMSYHLKNRVDTLAALVLAKWPDRKLKVLEAWDESNGHGSRSPHYEGRAVELTLVTTGTTDPPDDASLSLLAWLATQADFDFVRFDTAGFVYASVREAPPAKARNFVLISGGPGLFDEHDDEHDVSWANFVTAPGLMHGPKAKVPLPKEPDEEIWWFVYKPAYASRWSADVQRTDAAGVKAVKDVRDSGATDYVDFLERKAEERSWNLRWLSSADDLWTKLATFQDKISKVWYWGHANAGNLWFFIRHNAQHEAIAPPDDAIVEWTEIAEHGELRVKMQASSPQRRHRFVACNSTEFARQWSETFDVDTQGVTGIVQFGQMTDKGEPLPRPDARYTAFPP